jgi:phosphatidylglycerophosphate synthase
MGNNDRGSDRRPLKSRGSVWSRIVLSLLLKTSVTANQISCASMGFALIAGCALWNAGGGTSCIPLIIAVFGIQGRLLCNLMDGMVAVEGQRSGRLGQLYNEIPDRISDIVIILAAGFGYASYSIIGLSPVTLGWTAALSSVLTAYVRLLGASLGTGHNFCGPMGKPHRMALLTGACIVEMGLITVGSWLPIVPVALLIVNMGCVVTLIRRIRWIIQRLEG